MTRLADLLSSGLEDRTQASTGDTNWAAWAASIELTMVAMYDGVAAKLTGDNVTTAAQFRDHHQAHAAALGALAPGIATGQPNAALLFAMTPAMQALADEPSSMNFLMGLENQMAETYAYGLSLLTTPGIYQRVVETLPIESQHAAVLGETLQLSTDALFITGAFENASVGDGSDTRRGFDMTTFPLG